MRPLQRLSLLCALAMAHAAAAAASSYPVMLEAFSQSLLLGVKIAAQQGERKGSLSASESACVQAIDPRSLHDIFETLLPSILSPDELKKAEQFFATPAGKKNIKMEIIQVYTEMGLQAPEPAPKFSPGEAKQIQAFADTRIGEKIQQAVQSPAMEKTITARIQKQVQACGIQ